MSNQEPHPLRMSAENATRRQARLDTMPLNIFEQLTKLRPFVEVGCDVMVVNNKITKSNYFNILCKYIFLFPTSHTF